MPQLKPADHPNAAVAGLSGTVTTLVLYIAHTAGFDIPPEVAAAAATLVIAGALAAGRRRPAASPRAQRRPGRSTSRRGAP